MDAVGTVDGVALAPLHAAQVAEAPVEVVSGLAHLKVVRAVVVEA